MANEFDDVLDQESAGTLPPLSSGLEKGEFDDVLDTEVSQQRDYVRNVIDIASKDNPEAAAERIRLSQSTGLPPDVVARNQQELKRREIARAIDLQRMMRDSPVLFRQMTDPTFTAAAIDDLDTLRQIEKSFTNIADYAKSGEMASDVGGAAKSLALGATVGVGKMVFDIFGAATDLVGLDYLAGGYRTMSDNARQAMDAFGLQADTSTGRAVKSGLESAGQNLALLPLGLERGLFQTAEAAGAAVAGAMSVGVGADSYQRARGEGVGRLNSALYGLNDAGVEFLMEKIPAGQLFKGIELDNSLLKQLAQQTFTEGWTEQVTTIAQDFNEWMALHPEKTTAKFLAERPEAAYQTFIATLIGTGVQTTAIAGINKLVEKASNQALVYEQDRLKRQLQLAGMSALRERSPEQFRANMEQVVANAPEGTPTEIHVDAEVLNQLIPEMQALLPESVRAQIPEALAMNATVPISMADVLTIAPGTELEQILNDNARIGSPDAPSRVEAEKAAEFIQQDAERVLQQAQDQSAWQSEVDTVQQTIKDQLDQAGRFTSDVNEGYARLQSQFFSVMASRLGITPADMYQRFSVKVAGQMGQGEVLNAGADQTQTPKFKNWFGDSKVVDADGRPLVVHHGAPDTRFVQEDGIFKSLRERLGMRENDPDRAFFFAADQRVAASYADDRRAFDYQAAEPGIVSAYLSLKNPLVIDNGGQSWKGTRNVVETAKQGGHDGVIIRNVVDDYQTTNRSKPTDVYVAFSPTQIKSATGNSGTFDPNDPNILRQSAQFPIERKKDGSIVVRGDAEAIRALLPENIKGRKVDGGMAFTPSAAPRVKAALEGHQVAYSRGGHVVKKLPMKNGKYVGAPEKFNTPGKIPTLRKWLRQLTLEGAPGRYWYENSSAEILRMTGGDVQEARRFVALLSIYSPQAKVDANGTFALRAWAQYKAGQPISVKTGVQDEKARQALADVDAFWSGEKTGNFFNNLLRMIDPSVADKQGATIDMWMMRAAQYDTDAPTATQYAFMENETNRIAQELGWEPQQVQAAIWVAMKARMENKGVKERTEASSEKKGWIRFDRSETTGKEARVIIDAKNHRNNWLKHAFEHDPTREDTAQAKFDFGDAMIRHIGQLSFEARPGRTTGVLPGIHTASYEQQLEFQQAVQAAFLDEEGNDTLAQMLGLLVDNRTNILPGVWQGEVSPSQQQRIVMAPAKGDGGKTNVDPAQAEALNLYAAMSGLVARQEGVGWHRPFYKATKRDANGLDIRLGRALTPEETVALERAVDEWMTAQGKVNWNDGLAFISTPTGVRLVSFGAVDNATLQGDIVKVAESVLPDFEWAHFASDGNMPTNNWQENPDGQSYIHRASAAGRSDVLLWTRDVLAPRVQQVFDDFSQRYGWGDPGRLDITVDEEQARRDAEEQVSRRAAATPPATEYTQQSRGTFNPQTLLISLGPQSDLSTFLHESGHFFLEVMADLAAQPDAPAQVREDMGKVRAWFASGSGTAMLAKVEQDAKDAEADASRAEKAGDPDAAQKRAYADQVRSAYTFAVENGGADYMKTVAATFGQDVPRAYRIHLIRQFHERWAESFEQYLLEGKAPSAELQPLFRRFRAWLVNVYKSLTDFMRGRNLEVNDEIRQVFDRMLATDEQIAQAEEQSGLLPDFDATNEAIERLQERSLRNLKWTLNARSKFLKQFTKEAKELRKGVLAEVMAEFEQRPDVMASRAIRKVRNKDGAERDAKIAAIADATGYPTVEEMTAAVTALGPVNEAVEAEVDRRMLERHGDMATQEALEAAANDAVHNEARARALAAELKAQDEALNPRETTGETRQIQVRVGSKKEGTQRVETRTVSVTVNALVEAARAFGADLAARRQVGKLKNAIYLHRAAEARAGKAWQTATKKGDSKAAVQAKKDQLLNNQAVRALIDAQAEVRSAIEFFRKVTKGNNEKLVKGGRDPDVVNAMRAILGAYGIAPRTGKTALEYMELVQTNDPETAKALMPAVINAVSRNKPYTELTVEELRGLTDDLKSMWRLAKESRQIEVDGVRMSIEDAREKLYSRLEEKGIPDKVPGQTSARTAEDKAAENLRERRGNMTRVEQWSEAIDGGIGGPFNTILFRAIKVAADNYRAARAPVFKRLEEATQAVKPFIARTPINAPRLNYVFGLGDGHNNTGMAELLAALLNTGNESNKRKLLLGGRPGNPWATENPDGTLDTSKWDATIADLVADGTLRKEHFDYVQAVWDVLESLKPLAQESHRRVFGRYFSEVTAQPFVDPFGIARSGGYYPAKVDPALVPDGQLRELARQENESLEFSFPAAPSGWSKSRVENYTKPLLLDMNLMFRHIDEVLLFSHMQPSVNAVNRLLRDRKLVSALSRVAPEAYGSILTPWLAGAARQIVEEQVPSDGGFNRAASMLRSRTGLQLMTANISNGLQQITGAFTAAAKLEADGMERSALIKAAAKWVSNPKAFRDNVWNLSSYMRDRSESETSALLDTMRDIMFNPTLMENARKLSRRHGYFMQVFFDNTLSPVVWSAGYSAYLNKLPKVDTSRMSATEVQALLARQNREAILYADGLVRQTQGSNLPEDVSRFERGTGFVRLFTQFAGYFNMQANTNASSIVKLAEEGGLKNNAGRGFYILMMGLLMPIWVAEAIAIAFRGGPGDDDDDGVVWDDWIWAVLGLGTFKGLVAMVPVLGQIASAAVNRIATKSPADDRISVSPVLSVMESAVGGNFYTGYQLATGGEVNAQRAVKDLAMLIGLATGVPAYAVARPLGYAAGVAQGKIQPTGPVDAARGLVTGTASPESKRP